MTRNFQNFEKMWFEISAGTLACYGTTDPNSEGEAAVHSRTVMNLEECTIKLMEENPAFEGAPVSDFACQWQILHPTKGAFNFCIESRDFAYAWIVVFQDSCGKHDVQAFVSKYGKINGEQQVRSRPP